MYKNSFQGDLVINTFKTKTGAVFVLGVCFLLCLFAALASYCGDIMISGKGDDGYFWALVFSSENLGIDYFYPNIIFLRALKEFGFAFEYLYGINLIIQFFLLIITLILIFNLSKNKSISSLWVFLWVATSYEILFVTLFLMRDLYILLCILLILKFVRASKVNFLLLAVLALLRPFALFVLILFSKITSVRLIVFMSLVAIFFSYLSLSDGMKIILMPNAVFSGQQFNIDDVISNRNDRVSEGENELKKGVLSSPFLAPALMIIRPLVPNKLGYEYVRHNGLTGTIEFRSRFDPYVFWQNLIIPINCIYLSHLLIALYRGLIMNSGGQRRHAVIYLIATSMIAIISGQSRHHLMISWLEPILIIHTYKNGDFQLTKYTSIFFMSFALLISFITFL